MNSINITNPHATSDFSVARHRDDLEAASAAMYAAHKQKQSHLLAADDLIWIVSKKGPDKCGWNAGIVIGEWILHNGPVHSELLEVAEEIASYDDCECLDDVLLWVEPTVQRWYECMMWVRARMGCEFRCPVPSKQDDLSQPAIIEWRAKYKSRIVEGYTEYLEPVIADRGAVARRTLRAAVSEAAPKSIEKLILETWAEVLL